VNIFAKNKFDEEIFHAIFFLFILYYYSPFLDGNKKYCTTDLHLTIIDNKLSTKLKKIKTQGKK